MTATDLSKFQFPLLEELIKLGEISIEKAREYDQRFFGSFVRRKYLTYLPGRQTFRVTRAAEDSLASYHDRSHLTRKDSTRPLTSYFDPAAYGLRPARRKKKHERMIDNRKMAAVA